MDDLCGVLEIMVHRRQRQPLFIRVASRGGLAHRCWKKNPSWFRMQHSVIADHWCFSVSSLGSQRAEAFLRKGRSEVSANGMLNNLMECSCGNTGNKACPPEACARSRDIAFCSECAHCVDDDELLPSADVLRRCDFAVDPLFRDDGKIHTNAVELWEDPPHCPDGKRVDILCHPLAAIAPPLAALNDFEEMILSLVHPLVQVYTIPTTGELAYVGHICNFKQRVTEFFKSLPILPAEMPFVLVRPRLAPSTADRRPRPPVRAHVPRVWAAFQWLQRHNPYYREIQRNAESAAAWGSPDLQLPERYEDTPRHIVLTDSDFYAWMHLATQEKEMDGEGFPMGCQL